MNEQGSTTGGELQQGSWIGSAWGPAEHEVDGLGLALEQGDGDLAGGERLPHMPDQHIDHRGAAQSARHFLAEGGEPADEVEIRRGVGAVGSPRELR